MKEENIKPKYKVWDKIVVWEDRFTQVIYMRFDNKLGDYEYNWYSKNNLRLPTEEELSLYYN